MSRTYRRRGAAKPAVVLIGLGISLLTATTLGAAAEGPTFVDPTARIVNAENVHLGALDYVAPFAVLTAGDSAASSISIGDETNVQDSVTVNARRGSVKLGEQTILAHGANGQGASDGR